MAPPTAYEEYMQSHPIEPGRGTVSGCVLLEGKPLHILDVQTDPEYTMVDISKWTGFHTILGLPLLREGSPIGVVILGRTTARPFTAKQIELATTFTDQAVIAIENVRLFDEIQEKSQQLEVASQPKSQFLANMSHKLHTPLNAILVYTELMADGAYGEPSEKMRGSSSVLRSNGRHLLGLINDVLDLSKIEAGQLALELSDYSFKDIVQTVRSTLEPLAFDKKLAFKLELAPELPPGRGDARRLTQVLINLVGNASISRMRAKSSSRPRRTMAHSTCPSMTLDPALRAPIRPSYSSRPTTHHPQEGRHWSGTGHIEAHRRNARRQNLGRVAGGSRFDICVHLPVRVERQVENA